MTVALALFLAGHGLLHLLGVAKAFRLAPLPQLTQPIAPAAGVAWLVAAVLFVASAAAVVTWPRWWWLLAAPAIVVSSVAIVPSWSDARFGAAANVVAAAAALFGFLAQGPGSLRASYDHDVAQARGSFPPAPALTEADLTSLPAPVQRYLRIAGTLGQPRVISFWARMAGPSANMRVKAAALVSVAEASGPEMDQSETVTLFNDMCMFAPAS